MKQWQVNENGYVPLVEVAQRMGRVMESVKLACRQRKIPWHQERFKRHKADLNAVRLSDLAALLDQLSNMTRRKSRKGIKLRRRNAKSFSGIVKDFAVTRKARQAQEKVYGPPVWPEKPAETEEEQVPTSAPAMKPSVSYSNGLAPSAQWDAFVKSAQNTIQLAKQVGVLGFTYGAQTGVLSFERLQKDNISIH